jgi:erythritol transport system ATP-binding protein
MNDFPSGGQVDEVILETRHLSMVFPGTLALDNVNYKVYRGKVNALVGENGAGKSTLMNILAGVLSPTDGEILLDGKQIEMQSPRHAMRQGIGIIYQELNLFPNMSVVDNIFAGREIRTSHGSVDYAKEEAIAHKLLERLEEEIESRALVEDLRVGQQQVIEIAKALSEDVRILIMDEPTSALSVKETEVLFRIIRELKSQGVTIIYISHKLDELMQISDHITVLRDGRLVARAQTQAVNVNWIIEKMVGRRQDAYFVKEEHPKGETLLQVKHVQLRHPTLEDRWVVNDVSFDLRAGEILGFYGLMGSGRTELLECLMGRHPEAGGEVYLKELRLTGASIGGRIRRGLALVPEDRKRDGVVQTLSAASNMTLASLRNYLRGLAMYLSPALERSNVERMIKDLFIHVADPEQPIISLSGGNQQKVIVAKALLTSPQVLMLDEPTRGIDVGAKAEIFRIMNDLSAEGYGILFVTSELNEVLAMSDRILVMSRGKVTAELDRSEATEEKLVQASAADHLISEELGIKA